MKLHSRWVAAPVLLLLASLLALAVPPPLRHVNRFDLERARIQAHLEGAEGELLARDVSGLSPSQRAARARNLAELRAYRLRGSFPHNHRSFGPRTPSFVDEHGTRCAMAHLIERAGGAELVAAVAKRANHATIDELSSNPELLRWLAEQGLTVEEAARIQPGYETWGCVGCSSSGPSHAATTAAEVSLGLTTIGWNLSHIRNGTPGGLASILGIAIGFAGVGLGVNAVNDKDAGDRRLGTINAAVGLGSIVTGSLALARPVRTVEAGVASRMAGPSTAPLLVSDAAGGIGGIKVGVRTVF